MFGSLHHQNLFHKHVIIHFKIISDNFLCSTDLSNTISIALTSDIHGNTMLILSMVGNYNVQRWDDLK